MSDIKFIVDSLTELGVRLSERDGKLAIRGPHGTLDRKLVDKLKASKEPLLRELRRTASWRKDASGRLIFADGNIYTPTDTGGWVLAKHPTRRMTAPGMVEVAR